MLGFQRDILNHKAKLPTHCHQNWDSLEDPPQRFSACPWVIFSNSHMPTGVTTLTNWVDCWQRAANAFLRKEVRKRGRSTTMIRHHWAIMDMDQSTHLYNQNTWGEVLSPAWNPIYGAGPLCSQAGSYLGKDNRDRGCTPLCLATHAWNSTLWDECFIHLTPVKLQALLGVIINHESPSMSWSDPTSLGCRALGGREECIPL